MSILNLADCPEEPIRRIIWLDGLAAATRTETEQALQEAYFEARTQGLLHRALELRLHSRKRIMAWTRHENEARGRIIRRWNDGL